MDRSRSDLPLNIYTSDPPPGIMPTHVLQSRLDQMMQNPDNQLHTVRRTTDRTAMDRSRTYLPLNIYTSGPPPGIMPTHVLQSRLDQMMQSPDNQLHTVRRHVRRTTDRYAMDRSAMDRSRTYLPLNIYTSGPPPGIMPTHVLQSRLDQMMQSPDNQLHTVRRHVRRTSDRYAMDRSAMDRSRTYLPLNIYTSGPPPGIMPTHVLQSRLDQPMQNPDNRRPAPVAYDENVLSENFRNMSIESNTNSNATDLRMRQYYSRYDLHTESSNFPILDSIFMHNSKAIPPAHVQSNCHRIYEQTYNNDKTEYNIWTSPLKFDSVPIGHSYFSNENDLINDLIENFQKKSNGSEKNESLKKKSKRSDKNRYKFNSSNFPSLPSTHHTKVIDSSSLSSTKVRKQLSNTSNSGTAFNGSDEMILTNKLLIDQDFKKRCIYGLQHVMNGSDRKSTGTLHDQFGMFGLVSFMRSLQDGNTTLLTLTNGYPIHSLHKHANVLQNINPTNNGAFAENPLELHHNDYHVPPEYIFQHKIKHTLAPLNLDLYQEDTLFYLFYLFSGDIMQLMAAGKLRELQWRFFKGFNRWVRYAPENKFAEISSTHERAVYIIFDQIEWTRHRAALLLPLCLFKQPEEYQY